MSHIKTPCILILLLILSCPTFGFSKKRNKDSCSSSKEYITALQFLREKKDFKIQETEARKIALEVSKGCDEAAKRFIGITLMLSQAGLGTQDAIKIGLKFVNKGEKDIKLFGSVFRRSFLSKYLDMDLSASVNIALSLTAEFEGDKDLVRKDYENFVEFCLDEDKLDLPKPTCANMAARIAKKGQYVKDGEDKLPKDKKYKKPSAFSRFVKAYRFLRDSIDDKGPGLDIGSATTIAEELVSTGPDAVENFIYGYKYAISKDGLNLSAQDALGIAKKLASQTPTDKPYDYGTN